MTGSREDEAAAVDVDVLVVGAGPAGLTLACDLARSGVAFRLVEAFKGPHFTLLLFGVAPAQVGMDGLPVRVLRLPAAGLAAQAYGIRGDGLVLVRPDGYLAIHDAKPASDATARWFAEVLDEAQAA